MTRSDTDKGANLTLKNKIMKTYILQENCLSDNLLLIAKNLTQ